MNIYKLTSPSGKVYIGQTKNAIELRWNQHLKSWERWKRERSKKGGSIKLYFALDKYPPENWKIEVICECLLKEELDEKEKYYIQIHNSIDDGYNITKGGSGRTVDFLDEDHKKNLSKARKDYFNTDEGLKWKSELSNKFSGGNNPSCGRGKEISEQNSKWYLLLDIDDNELIIKNLHQFQKDKKCKKINLFPNDNKSKYSKLSEYRGSILENYSEDLSENEKRNIIDKTKSIIKPLKTWKVISPLGEIFIIKSLKNFCRDKDLIPQCLGKVSRGLTKKYKGWVCEIIE